MSELSYTAENPDCIAEMLDVGDNPHTSGVEVLQMQQSGESQGREADIFLQKKMEHIQGNKSKWHHIGYEKIFE